MHLLCITSAWNCNRKWYTQSTLIIHSFLHWPLTQLLLFSIFRVFFASSSIFSISHFPTFISTFEQVLLFPQKSFPGIVLSVNPFSLYSQLPLSSYPVSIWCRAEFSEAAPPKRVCFLPLTSALGLTLLLLLGLLFIWNRRNWEFWVSIATLKILLTSGCLDYSSCLVLFK